MKKKLAVIHYLPLEFYPPVTNLLDCISDRNKVNVHVFSTHNNKDRKAYQNGNLYISRVVVPSKKDNVVFRLFKYLLFNFWVFLKLCWFRPDSILYYETYSVGPVYWYFKLLGKHTKLYIHYHEYASNMWYVKGMKLVKRYHKLEKKYLYKKAVNISQTNQDRIDLFLRDNKMVTKNQMIELPNYPPNSWKDSVFNKVQQDNEVVKTIYVGSLSLKNKSILS